LQIFKLKNRVPVAKAGFDMAKGMSPQMQNLVQALILAAFLAFEGIKRKNKERREAGCSC